MDSASISNFIFYFLIFTSVYVQVFLLLTLLENRKKIVIRKEQVRLSSYPAVTITVPCWNEETTIQKTVESLINLNYPKDKLKILLIDDGSTDNTLEVLKKYSHHENIEVIHKENGGKHSVLNLGLEISDADFFGCLDADSIVDPEALVRIMSSFEEDPEAMAVVPSVNVTGAKNVIQNAQQAEYQMGVFMKKMLDFLGAINVTPGPFTIFKKKVFEDLGPYKKAHNTEDMEIAYRMQTHDYKIIHCNDAYVYTHTPATIKKLYKQRARWIYGFINNTLDYRKVILKKRYGNFALFTLPTGIISVMAVTYIFGRMIYGAGSFLYHKIIEYQTVGFSVGGGLPSLDPFFIETSASMFLITIIYGSVAFAIIFGGKMTHGKFRISINMLYFLILFRIIAPFWIMKAVYQTIVGRTPNWR